MGAVALPTAWLPSPTRRPHLRALPNPRGTPSSAPQAPDGLGGTATVTALLDVQAAAQYDWVGGRAANVRNFDYRLTTVEREPGSLPF